MAKPQLRTAPDHICQEDSHVVAVEHQITQRDTASAGPGFATSGPLGERNSGAGQNNVINNAANWQRELAASRLSRETRSRASSIISCRTRLTTMTDDARSVIIQAGGHSFHISRDGGMVSDITAPPPYPGPPLTQFDEPSQEERDDGRPNATGSGNQTLIDQPQLHQSLQDLPLRTYQPEEPIEEESPTTNRKAVTFELPQRLRTVLSFWNSTTANQDHTTTLVPPTNALRRSQSDSSTMSNVKLFESIINNESNTVEEDDEDNMPAMAIRPDEVSDLRKNYRQLVRDLDHQQRRKLHERDKEMAGLRILLDEKDKILRQQLRGKDFIIETLRNELAVKERLVSSLSQTNIELGEGLQVKLEKAKNEVEDAWEARWKAFEQLLLARFELSTEHSMDSSALLPE